MNLENLVLEGGGVRALAYIGALEELEKSGSINYITRFAGSSAGAIIAALLAVGYTVQELTEIMVNLDWESFKDKSVLNFLNFFRFFKKFGFYKGDAFTNWLGKLILDKTGNENYTFLDLFSNENRILVVTGMCVNKRELHMYHYQSNPDMPIKLAVRISIGLPYMFAAVKWKNDILIDGGTLDNYPIYIFDNIVDDVLVLPNTKIKTNSKFKSSKFEKNEKTLGLKLLDNLEDGENLYSYNKKITSILDFTFELINSLLLRIERLQVHGNYWERTMIIKTGSIDTINLSLTKEEKEYLISQGRKCAEEYIKLNNQ